MPRPTTSQIAYGSLTVVLFTFALLLLADVRSGLGVAAVGAAGLVLGLLVAAALGAQRRPSTVIRVAPGPTVSLSPARVGATEHLVGESSVPN